MGAKELEQSKAPTQDKERPAARPWVGILLILFVAASGGAFWLVSRRAVTGAAATMTHHDPLYGFVLSYPANWVKTQDNEKAIGFGIGQEADADMARVNVFHDKLADHLLTGLTDGFYQYEAELKNQSRGCEVTSVKGGTNGNVTYIFFAFRGASQQGEGLYLLNAETRLVVECHSPPAAYERHRTVFDSILASFQFEAGQPAQQYIEYPMPDSAMNALASSNPAKLSREVNDYLAEGDDLLKNRLLNPGNLALAVQEYRRSVQLSLAGPDRLPAWRHAAEGLVNATRLFNQALNDQRVKIKIAENQGDFQSAFWAAQRMMQMVPDQSDPAYAEACREYRKLGKVRP
jgi:hypothetical protein